MKRRSFLTALAAAFVLPRLPAADTKKLLIIADEINELPGFSPLDYVGEFKWVNLTANNTDPHGKFTYPIVIK
jgi:hypothetical protein